MMTWEQAKTVLAALEREGVRYVLVGSMGLAAHGLVRATRDMDFFVASDDDNVIRLKRALRSVFDDPSLEEICAEELRGSYPAVQYMPPEGDYSIDILARLGEMYRYEDLEWEEISVDDISVRVATAQMLYRMKRDTVRPQDKTDAAALRQYFDISEE